MKGYIKLFAVALVATTLCLGLVACSKVDNIAGPETTISQTTSDSTAAGQKPGAQAAGGTIADQNWWRNLSQAERNMSILYKADSYNNRLGYYNCKEWARKVVLEASRNVVYLPSTLPNGNGWYYGYSPYLVGMSGGIRSSAQGTIVQLNWRLNNGTITPHTMIVASRTGSGINVIEANWSPGKVAYRWIPFTEFDAKVTRYSCYFVVGG